jgi:hypothetical protein
LSAKSGLEASAPCSSCQRRQLCPMCRAEPMVDGRIHSTVKAPYSSYQRRRLCRPVAGCLAVFGRVAGGDRAHQFHKVAAGQHPFDLQVSTCPRVRVCVCVCVCVQVGVRLWQRGKEL